MNDSTPTRNPNMTRTTSASTSILAKLLAREDLTVVSSPSADTAYFNGATRTLTLPVWQNMSDDLTEMLVSHEVGHALHTPAGEAPILDAIRSIDPAMSAEAKFYINIAEDARIEQEIKSEFPGTRKTFAVGYRDILGRNFFDLDAIPMNQRTLCDRINIHAKVGFAVEVPFDDYEREILDAVMNAKSWEDVVENAKAMWEYDGTIGRKKIENAKSQNPSGAPGSAAEDGEESEGDGDGDGNSDSQDSQESGKSDSQDSQESNKSDSQNSGSETGKNSEEKTEKKSASSQSSNEDENTDNEGNTTRVPIENVAEFAKPGAPASQAAIEKGLNSLRSRHESERLYGVMPTPNLSEEDGIIIPFKKVLADLNQWLEVGIAEQPHRGLISNNAYSLFRRENDKQVTLMVREFERRRAAVTHRRTRTGNRGVINVNRLHTYKFSEDIFKTYSITKDGKSHGMVMFVDWSSSMGSVIGDTMNQTLSLASFCRKAGIPFEVYGFSSQDPKVFREGAGQYSGNSTNLWSRTPGELNAYGFSLLNLLSSRMSKKEFEDMSRILICFTDSIGGNEFVEKVRTDGTPRTYNYRWGYNSTAAMYGLGGTPLHSAIVAAHDLLPKFRAATRSQILTTIFLTDGEGTDHVLSRVWTEDGKESSQPNTGPENPNAWSCPVYARHRSTREFFKVGYSAECREVLLESLRSVTGTRILGFNILHASWRNLAKIRRGNIYVDWTIRRHFLPTDPTAPAPSEEFLAKIVDKAAEDGVLAIPYSDGKKISPNAYDELYVLSSKSMAISEGDEMDRLDGNATLTKIRNAFMKQNATGRKSRVFLNRFIPMIAESI